MSSYATALAFLEGAASGDANFAAAGAFAGAAYAWPPIIAPATANATIVLIILRSPCPPPRLGGVVFRKFLTDVWR